LSRATIPDPLRQRRKATTSASIVGQITVSTASSGTVGTATCVEGIEDEQVSILRRRAAPLPLTVPNTAGIGYCEAMRLDSRKDHAMTVTLAAIFLYTPAAPVALLCLAGLAIVVGLCSL